MKKSQAPFRHKASLLCMGLLAMASIRSDAGGPKKPEEPPSSDIISLAETLTPLKSHFNKHKGKVRFVTLLSPT